MTTELTPARVSGDARPEFDVALVEIAKRNGEFRKNYGPWLGAFLYLRSLNAARPRSVWWTGLVVAGITAAAALIQRYGWPAFLLGVAS